MNLRFLGPVLLLACVLAVQPLASNAVVCPLAPIDAPGSFMSATVGMGPATKSGEEKITLDVELIEGTVTTHEITVNVTAGQSGTSKAQAFRDAINAALAPPPSDPVATATGNVLTIVPDMPCGYQDMGDGITRITISGEGKERMTPDRFPTPCPAGDPDSEVDDLAVIYMHGSADGESLEVGQQPYVEFATERGTARYEYVGNASVPEITAGLCREMALLGISCRRVASHVIIAYLDPEADGGAEYYANDGTLQMFVTIESSEFE